MLIVIALTGACGLPQFLSTGPQSTEPATPTPAPDFHGQAFAICAEYSDAIQGLGDRLTGQVTDANLVGQGTVVASLAGVISTELEHLRSIPFAPLTADQEPVTAWLDELDATVQAQVLAVSASAARDTVRFRMAAQAAVKHWEAAGLLASRLGLDTCRAATLGPPS